MKCLGFLLFLELFQRSAHDSISPSTIEQLYNNVTTGYNPRLRPAYDQSAAINVYASARPYAVVELSTSDQRLTLLIYFTITWTDQFLTWNASEFGGRQWLKFKLEEIWHPQLMMGQTYSDEHIYIKDDVGQVLVFHNGTVLWNPAVSVSVLCVVDITLYPFDTQECEMYLVVPYPSFDEIELHISPAYDLLSGFEANPQWDLLHVEPQIVFEGLVITYTYQFRRRAEFVVYITIVPLILLSVLNACAVLVPVSSGEKGSIAVTLFLSYCVYLTAIGQTLPPNAIKSSYLLLYMTVVQVASALTMLYSVLETRMSVYSINSFLPCIASTSGIRNLRTGFNDTQLHTKPNHRDTLADRDATTDHLRNANQNDRPEAFYKMKDAKTADPDTLSMCRRMDNIAFIVLLVMNVGIVVVFGILVNDGT